MQVAQQSAQSLPSPFQGRTSFFYLDLGLQIGVCQHACLQEGLEVWAHLCGELHWVLDDLVDQGVDGGCVERGLPHKQFVQNYAQAPQISLQYRVSQESRDPQVSQAR